MVKIINMATAKQKKSFKKSMENGGNISKAMRDSGYSENSAKNPQKQKKTKGWNELMEKYIPDEDLAKKHKELLNKQEVYLKNNNKTGKIEVIKTGEIDAHAVGRGLDMGYKLKNKYAAEKVKLIKDDNANLTDEEIEEELDRRRKLRESGKKSNN